MTETFSMMKDRIEHFCIQLQRDVMRLPQKGTPARVEALCKLLDRIVQELGVYDYSFSYAAQGFASSNVGDCIGDLTEIYHQNFSVPFFEDDSNTPNRLRLRAFVAFFLVITYYIHYGKTNEVKALLEDPQYDNETAFRDMPLYFDLRSRFSKRSEDKKDKNFALVQNKKAIDMLENLGCQNVAVSCSFASTVSRMLQDKKLASKLSFDDAKKAVVLIDGAIAYNPDYAKYHYIRAKLRFYLEAKELSGRQRLESLLSAKDECELALIRESTLRADYGKRTEDYKQLLEKINEEIDRLEPQLTNQEEYAPNDTPEALKALREEILNSSTDIDLSRFPIANTHGGKYVFICYNRSDYKLVYCDLLEMAARRIPFLYDRDAVLPGYNWDEACAKRILDPNCAGIIFYLGSTSVLSAPLDKEIRVVREKADKMRVQPNELLFSVNLTNENYRPSMMLVQSLRKAKKRDLQKANLDSERIVRFLSTFTDSGDFIRRGILPDDLSHMDQVERAIRNKFHIQLQRECRN